MDKLTIVVLNDYCHINGGASKIAIDEAISLAEAGLEVIFLGASGPVCDALMQAPLRVICLEQPELIEAGKNPLVMLQGLWNQAAYRKMQELLATLDAARTVIHLHGYTKSLTASPVRAAINAGFRVVCTLHDFFTACPNGAFFDYQKNHVCPKRALSLDCITTHCDKRAYAHKLYRVARSGVQHAVGKLPNGVKEYITLSNHSAALLKPYLPPGARYHALENLIEAENLPPVDPAAGVAVMAVGRLDVEKGIEILLEASKISGVPVTLVGDGPLRLLAEATPGCTVTGWVTPKEVMEYLGRARALAFPSLWYEAYGLVVAEAASRGVPAIVSHLSAAAERVEHGVHGWIVQAGDAEGLARILLETQEAEKLRALGRAAYDRFWKHPPTRANHTEGLCRIYASVLDSRSQAA